MDSTSHGTRYKPTVNMTKVTILELTINFVGFMTDPVMLNWLIRHQIDLSTLAIQYYQCVHHVEYGLTILLEITLKIRAIEVIIKAFTFVRASRHLLQKNILIFKDK